MKVSDIESRAQESLLRRILLWILAFVVMLCFSFIPFFFVQERVKGSPADFEIINKTAQQRMLLGKTAYLSHLLTITNPQSQPDIRQEIENEINQIEMNHQWMMNSISQMGSRELYPEAMKDLNYSLFHHVDSQMQEYLRNLRALLNLPVEQLIVTNPYAESIKNTVESGALANSLIELAQEHEKEFQTDINNLQRREKWMLAYNLLMLWGIAIFIIFPISRKIRNQFNRLNIVNKALNDKTDELRRSHLAALSMMEDAMISHREAEKSRDAALKLAAIVESSNDTIISKTLDGIITSWNKAAQRMYGFTEQEAKGKTIHIIVPDDQFEEISEILKKLNRGERIDHYETIRRHKNGRLIDVSLTISPIKDSAGNLIGASSIARDITDIKQARFALQEREKWFRALIENSTDLLLQYGRDTKIIYTSPSVTRILGYQPEEFIGRSIFELIHTEDLGHINKLLKELMMIDGHIITTQCRILHQDGSWRWIEGTGCNLLKEPHIRAIVINGRDITERKKAAEELRKEKERAQRYLDIAEVMLLVLNEQGQVILINKKGLKILGYENENEILGKDWFEYFLPDELKGNAQKNFDLLMSGQLEEAKYYEHPVITRSGDQRLVAWHNSCITNENGQRIGTLSSGEDITQRRRDEEKLKRYTQELQVSNKELEQFAFVASHDLQEPLRIVSSYIQLFAKRYQGSLDSVADKYIDYVVTNIDRMQKMIEGLLAYSRIGKREQFLNQIDAGEMCDRAISNLKLLIVKCQAEVTRDPLATLWASETELIQLFQNLIGNAIKYCDKEKPNVHISARQQGSDWLFSIRDNGIGIESEYSDRIFELFKRLHTKKEYPGTGIGLTICKKIVEKNGGRIWVESVLGKGSTFYFTIPQRNEVYHEQQTS